MFLDGGLRSATVEFFPQGKMDTMRVATAGLNPGVEVEVEVWGLESTWVAKGNATATTAGQNLRRDSLGHLGGGRGIDTLGRYLG